MHGRHAWYAYRYSPAELRELAEAALSVNPSSVYVFFNNDHDMLLNGREMREMLERMAST